MALAPRATAQIRLLGVGFRPVGRGCPAGCSCPFGRLPGISLAWADPPGRLATAARDAGTAGKLMGVHDVRVARVGPQRH
jgi:hypothetical protein